MRRMANCLGGGGSIRRVAGGVTGTGSALARASSARHANAWNGAMEGCAGLADIACPQDFVLCLW